MSKYFQRAIQSAEDNVRIIQIYKILDTALEALHSLYISLC